MRSPLISTKFQIPSISHDVISRPRLTSLLNNGLKSKLILICAPAGFGKTTLAASWLSTQNMHKAWVSLSEDNNDALRFICDIASALEGVSSIEGTQLLFSDDNVQLYEAVFSQLIRDISDSGKDCILVLDGFQVVTDTVVFESLLFLLNHLPPNMRIVITSRSETNLPLAKLGAKNQLTKISTDDLRFTLRETRTFIEEIPGISLEEKSVKLLNERTEGWVGGLQLAVSAAQGSPAPEDLVSNLSGNDYFIADFFIEEILEHLPLKIQQFLLHTSVFEQFSAGLCDDVLEIDDSRTIIEQLESSNIFIFSLDTTRTWYRYHQLFAHLLQSRLELQFPEKIGELYRKASHWYRKNGKLAEALGSSIKGCHYDQVEAIIEEVVTVPIKLMPLEKEGPKVVAWLNQLPTSLQASLKARLLTAMFFLESGKIGNSENLFKQVLTSTAQHHHNGNYISLCTLGMACIAYHRYLDGEMTCKYYEQRNRFYNNPKESFLFSFINGKGKLLLGDLAQAKHYLDEATALSDKYGVSIYILPLAWGRLYKAKGQLQKALVQYKTDYDENASDLFVRGASYFYQTIGQADIYYQYNELETCRKLLLKIEDHVENIELSDIHLEFHDILIKLYCASNNFEKARGVLEQLIKILNEIGATPIVLRRIMALKANLALKEGDVGQASQYLRTIGSVVKDKVGYDVESELIALVRIHLARNGFVIALELIERMLVSARDQNRVHSLIELETLAAKTYFLLGENEESLARLKIALTVAQPEGYIRVFVDEGQPIQLLLQTLSKKHDNYLVSESLLGYIQTLLENFDSSEQQPKKITIPPGRENTGIDVDGLTRREKQVLELIAQGLAYEAISSRLGISVNTVRFHIKNLYSKLNVNSRFMAVKEAHQKMLIEG